MPYSIYREIRSYNDQTGEYISVSEDSDALELVEFRQVDHQGKRTAAIVVTREQAAQFADAIKEYLASVGHEKGN